MPLYPPASSGSGAPTDAEYIVAATSAGLSAERVPTNTATVTWDTGTSGQLKANAAVDTLATDINLTGVIAPTDATKQDNWNPTGLADASRIDWVGTASIGITGLAGGADGRVLSIHNDTTGYLLWLEHENTASTAANRFSLPKGFPAFLMPGDRIVLIYDGTESRWAVLSWPQAGQAMGLTEFTDYVGGVTGPFANPVSGTGASAQISPYLLNTTERPLGSAQFDTGTTAAGRAGVGFTGGDTIIPTLGPALSVARLAVETTVTGTETFQVVSGFTDSAGGTFTDGVFWNNRWTGSAAEWSQDRRANSVVTQSNTGSPTPDNNYIWLVVFLNNDWTRADFIYSTDSVSFTKAASPTTGIPGSTRNTGWMGAQIIKSLGTSQRNISVDLCGYRVDYVRG